VSGIDTLNNRYYQLIYEDKWGSQTPTDIEAGVTYTHFFKTFGGENEDVGYSVQQTSDGGYIVAGYTNSYGSGSYDVLLLKTDSDGNELWMQTFGEGYDDRGYSIQQTSDGGFVIAGYTYSFDSDSYDMWLLKTNIVGDTLWTKTYGGTGTDKGYSVQQTSDGGFIITGYTKTDSKGFDMFLVKTDSDGNQEWTKTYGGTGTDKGSSVQQTSDGGFIISGVTTAEYGFDIMVVKTDPTGEEEWNQVFGNILHDMGLSVDQTIDGGFVVVGYTEIFGSGDEDVLLLKLNSDGSPDWEKTFGGNGIDHGYSVQQTNDDGFMIIGFTESFGDGNKDVWLIKTNADGSPDWERTFGGNDIDHGYSVQLTNDDGFIITGYTKSEDNNVDILLIKDHPLGSTQNDY
jgi:uncharacterized delta-60 repeat protein